ncbi:MAG: lactate utilization protein [Candidatus Levybacteria bacterium]|nr:lactate utilization protein [Candidatus Levybacteria bacterium]
MTSSQTNNKNNFNELADNSAVLKTINSLKANGFLPITVSTKEEAFEKIQDIIPSDASVMNGTSATLKEIGYIDYLKEGQHKWNNLHEKVLAELDPEKQSKLRKTSVISDFYLGSAHAVTQNGEILIASNTGSQLPHLVFTSQNIIFVVGAQKIVTDLDEAFKRLEEHVIPLEDERMKGVYGVGTTHAKTLILHKENPMMGRQIYVIIVNEKLGF